MSWHSVLSEAAGLAFRERVTVQSGPPRRSGLPPLTRWYIKTSLVHFVAVLIVGLVLMLRLIVDLLAFVAALQPTYVHLLMLGWVAQLVFGVAFWIPPRSLHGAPRGDERPAVLAFVLLNAGVLLVGSARPSVCIPHGL